jgi:flagellar basal body P-ring formation protein FlgA
MRKVHLMIRSIVRQTARILALACALAALWAAPVAAENGLPALRASVTVTGDLVRIGDLVENAGAVAEVPIFRSPDLGTRGAVPVDRIVEAIRPHHLINIDTRGLAEVSVTRAARTISGQEISTRVTQIVAARRGSSDTHNIAVTFDRDARTVQVEANATGELQVIDLNYDQRTGRFDVTLDLAQSAIIHRQPLRVTGVVYETLDVVVPQRQVERGEVLKASDVTIVQRPKAEGPALTDLNTAIGLAARHQLRSGQPLHDTDLMRPDIVQRSEVITLVYEAPGIVLTLRGQAQEAGALGDTIGVLNMESKRVVQGVISAPGRVTVDLATSRFVQGAPKAAQSSSAVPPSKFE